MYILDTNSSTEFWTYDTRLVTPLLNQKKEYIYQKCNFDQQNFLSTIWNQVVVLGT